VSHEDGAPEDVNEDVRRLLVSAASPGPTLPAEVAERLDTVLADLVASRSEEGAAGSPVVPLVPRRRRWPQVLVAAAAVSVLSLGVGTVLRDGGMMSAREDAASGSAAESADRPETLSDKGAGEPAPTTDQDTQGSAEMARSTVLRLRTRSLALDLQRVRDFALAVPAGARWSAACVRPATTTGDEWLPVRLDGEPAVLLLRAPTGDRRRADVYTCEDGAEPAATGTVGAP